MKPSSVPFVAAAVLLSACAFHRAVTDRRVVMQAVDAQMAGQYHACIPLGWDPVPVARTFFYPGFSASLAQNMWLPPMWAGTIHSGDLSRLGVREVSGVLDELARQGMVSKEPVPGGFHYHLTLRAIPYFYGSNQYGNNPDHLPYLCYSTIVPTRVLWAQSIHVERDTARSGSERVFRAAFSWRSSASASWARDAVLQSHSVILAPFDSPSVVKFVDYGGDWEIDALYSRGIMLPRVATR